jgi:succinoglycan biosynthesis protein ExoW
MISIIIPYYQRAPGILAKALASIAAQKSCPHTLNVIVVDDASPAPVGPEIAQVGALPFKVQTIRQTNSGPAGARNTGLNHVLPGTRYIAFLDSDDEWLPEHLARAVAALEAGHDFYFSNFYQLNQTQGAFARAGRLNTTQHPQLPHLAPGLHAYQGDMLNQIITGNVIGTPTVVYVYERFKNERFNIKFTAAGEDYLFWMALARQGAKIAFSSLPEVRCGQGVNIYSGSNWGSPQFLLRTHHELNYRKETLRLYALTSAQRCYIKACLHALRRAFISDLLHRIRHMKNIPFRLLVSHLHSDPLTFLLIPQFFSTLVFKKISALRGA